MEPQHPGSAVPDGPCVREVFSAALAFTVLTLLLLWPVPASLTTHLPGDLGDPLLNAWILSWGADRLPHALQGFRDPPIFYPYTGTLAYNEHLLGITLLVAPLHWLTGNPVLAYNAAFLLSFVLAGVGMYLLARALTGSPPAAALAALIFAFAPPRWAHLAHLQVLTSGWMPVSLWALHRYAVRQAPGWLAVATGAFILQGLSNSYFLFFATVPLVLVAAVELGRRGAITWRTAGHLIPAGLVVVAVFLPIAVVYAGAGLMGAGLTGAPAAPAAGDEMARFSATWRSYVSVPAEFPRLSWLPSAPNEEVALFPGTVVLLMVVAAVWPGTRDVRARRWIPLYLLMAAAAMVLSFGSRPWFWPFEIPAPYGWLAAWVPGFGALRVPARFGTIVLLALAVVAAFGTARFLRRVPVRSGWTIAALLGAWIVMEAHPGTVPVARFHAYPAADERAAYAWIREGSAGAAIELPMQSRLMIPGRSDLRYQHNTRFHGRPIVNGSGRFQPPLTSFLKGPASPFGEPARLEEVPAMLRALGVRSVLVRRHHFRSRPLSDETVRAFRSAPDVTEHRTFGVGLTAIEGFRLAPPDDAAVVPARARRVPEAAFLVTASHWPDRIRYVRDDRLDTRWSSGSAQTGTETIEIELDRPRAIVALRIEQGRTLADYPRGLEVHAVDEEGTARPLFSGAVLPRLVLGILASPRTTPIDIPLPGEDVRRLRLRQTGSAEPWQWSIHRLGLWER